MHRHPTRATDMRTTMSTVTIMMERAKELGCSRGMATTIKDTATTTATVIITNTPRPTSAWRSRSARS